MSLGRSPGSAERKQNVSRAEGALPTEGVADLKPAGENLGGRLSRRVAPGWRVSALQAGKEESWPIFSKEEKTETSNLNQDRTVIDTGNRITEIGAYLMQLR